jgi:hypothetical protein
VPGNRIDLSADNEIAAPIEEWDALQRAQAITKTRLAEMRRALSAEARRCRRRLLPVVDDMFQTSTELPVDA